MAFARSRRNVTARACGGRRGRPAALVLVLVPDNAPGITRPASPPRLVALAAVRGLTVAPMLLVNDPGSWGHMFHPLEHAAWNGWTPTDLIFPFFLFIVGITTQLSMDARRERGASDADLLRQIRRRSALIAGI